MNDKQQGGFKEWEPDDPMELVFVSLPDGNPELMATCIIEEYAHLGMSQEEILRLFRLPIYRTHVFYRTYGEGWVRDLIARVLERTGQFRVRIVEYEHEAHPTSELQMGEVL